MISLSTAYHSMIAKNKWPVTSVTLLVSSLGYAFFFYMASLGYPGGDVASNCFEDYLRTPDCYCETLRGHKPGDVWIAQPMNTLSNIWFVVAGVLCAYACDSKSFPSTQVWQNKANVMTQDDSYTMVYAISTCLLGIGSTFLHAAFTTWSRQLDMVAMYTIVTFQLYYPMLQRGILLNKEQAVWLYVTSNLALAHWTLTIATPVETRRMFMSLLVLSILFQASFLGVDHETAQRNTKSRRMFLIVVLFFSTGAITWKVSESGAPLCYPDSLWQGHSLWHLQSAIGIGGIYFCYLYEVGSPVAAVPKRSSSIYDKALGAKASSSRRRESDNSDCDSSMSSESGNTSSLGSFLKQ